MLVLDLTTTRQASHDYCYPELTNASIWISSRFSAQLTSSVEVFFLGEWSSAIYIDPSRKLSENVFLNKAGKRALMGFSEILLQLTKRRYLRHRFVGVFSADTFSIPLNENTFIIVNSENSNEEAKT